MGKILGHVASGALGIVLTLSLHQLTIGERMATRADLREAIETTGPYVRKKEYLESYIAEDIQAKKLQGERLQSLQDQLTRLTVKVDLILSQIGIKEPVR